jgi:hypothetical protein
MKDRTGTRLEVRTRLTSRRVGGQPTRALRVVRVGMETTGRRPGARCAVKGCSREATMFCQRSLGLNTRSPCAMVAVIGYCEPCSALSQRFQDQTWQPWT